MSLPINGTNNCSSCAYKTKGRTCPIFQRLHEWNVSSKMWALNITNFGCILYERYGQATGSVLDKLDHTKRLKLVQETRIKNE